MLVKIINISYLKSLSKIIWPGLLLLTFCIPLSQYFSVKILLLISVISCFNKAGKGLLFNLVRFSFDKILYLVVLLVGLLYSSAFDVGLKTLETNFGFLAFLIIFKNFETVDEEMLSKIFYFFVFGILSASIICLINALIAYSQSNDSSVFFFYQLTSIIGVQPIYFAYYLIFGIAFCLYQFYYRKGKMKDWLQVTIILFQFILLMLTGGQTAFISMLLVFSFFILKFFVEEKTSIRTFTFTLTCLMVGCMFLASSKNLNRADTILTDSWERFVLWESAWDANKNLLFGVGTGDYKMVLNEYYKAHDLAGFAKDSYNSHNQFIQILLTNGVLGVISVLLLICRPLYLAFTNRHVLGVLVLFPFLIYGTTEVFLGRYQGVVFFALLHQVFTSYYASQKPSLANLKGL